VLIRFEREREVGAEVGAMNDRPGVHAVVGAHRGERRHVIAFQERDRIRRPPLAPLPQPVVQVQLERLPGHVEVDLREHVVPRHDQRFECVNTPLVDADAPFAGFGVGDRMPHSPVSGSAIGSMVSSKRGKS